MSLRFPLCFTLAAASHLGLLFVLPNSTPPILPASHGEFSIEIRPTRPSAASMASPAEPHKVPDAVAPNEFKPARNSESSEVKTRRVVEPLTSPTRELQQSQQEQTDVATPVARHAEVEVEPTEEPPIHSPKQSFASPNSPAAPLAKKGVRTLPKLGVDFHPTFPDEARQLGLEGVVVLEIIIAKTGELTSARIVKSSGHELLDQAALRDVRKARFQPGRIGDEPSEMTALLPIAYRLVDSR